MKKTTLTDAYAAFGCEPKNIQWSWSARNDHRVVILAWQDHFLNCSEYKFPALPQFKKDRLGFKELIENLRWARKNCNNRVKVVIARAVDTSADRRRIARCNPRPDIEMEIRDLNEETGEFTGIIHSG